MTKRKKRKEIKRKEKDQKEEDRRYLNLNSISVTTLHCSLGGNKVI